MFHRLINTTKSNSYFLFGARGTGKTTLLKKLFPGNDALYIDLLDPLEEDLFIRNPAELVARISSTESKSKWIIIDEIQRVPKLLDLVHQLIEKDNFKFVLTGSSARKLKRGTSNLLAGRAFVFNMFPLVHSELQSRFNLDEVLKWGSLPKIFQLDQDQDKARFLKAYTLTYLKEEIVSEQIIRRLEPFRYFLEVAAQMNGRIINYSRIASDVGVDTKTVQVYFSILEDTLVGHLLPAYHTSIRKQQRGNPKFYFFDLGVKRALDKTVTTGLIESTYAYGETFEHFIILEILRLFQYQELDWQLSYLRTKDGAEIDLIIDRPGLPTALLEIKSASQIQARDTATLQRFAPDFPSAEFYCLSRDPYPKKIGPVDCLPWEQGLAHLLPSIETSSI